MRVQQFEQQATTITDLQALHAKSFRGEPLSAMNMNDEEKKEMSAVMNDCNSLELLFNQNHLETYLIQYLPEAFSYILDRRAEQDCFCYWTNDLGWQEMQRLLKGNLIRVMHEDICNLTMENLLHENGR